VKGRNGGSRADFYVRLMLCCECVSVVVISQVLSLMADEA